MRNKRTSPTLLLTMVLFLLWSFTACEGSSKTSGGKTGGGTGGSSQDTTLVQPGITGSETGKTVRDNPTAGKKRRPPNVIIKQFSF
jgi:hypothetical protein